MSRQTATSGDGSVLAGWVSPSRDSATASIFRWSANRGFLEIAMSQIVPAFPPPLPSADGSILVGTLGAEPETGLRAGVPLERSGGAHRAERRNPESR